MQIQDLNYVMGIETSCDETGIAVYHREKGLVSDVLYSQTALHTLYGGVVPELAARDHTNRIMPLIKKALDKAHIQLRDIDGIAYCAGPGLVGALLVGASIGRSLGWALQRPTVGIHHLEAHLLSVMLETDHSVQFPFVALLVSGGHTLLASVSRVGEYNILGETLDDAAGEAFDKTAKLLGLEYPGGPALAKLAQYGEPNQFQFPRPLCDQPNLDFSFSGLKTHVSRCWERIGRAEDQKANIARAFEEAIIDILTIKAQRALQETGLKDLVIAGGVSANKRLRTHLREKLAQNNHVLHCPPPQFCTDNGSMIAYAGFLRLAQGQLDPLSIQVRPRWSISDL
jgi:N6-L-threonylcarbamoyladenine synthase